MVVLSAGEARVAGALIEKEITTPEYYPLSLNALLNACNQKSSRDPVMEMDEAQVRDALASLEELSLVRVQADARVPKFEHRFRDQLNLRRDEVAILCLLLLRGAQTPGELRSRAERLYSFDDTAALLATLERMAGRDAPLVRAMARQPGAREVRWQHLLSGAPEETTFAAAASAGRDGGAADQEALAEMLAALEERVRLVEEHLARIKSCPMEKES